MDSGYPTPGVPTVGGSTVRTVRWDLKSVFHVKWRQIAVRTIPWCTRWISSAAVIRSDAPYIPKTACRIQKRTNELRKQASARTSDAYTLRDKRPDYRAGSSGADDNHQTVGDDPPPPLCPRRTRTEQNRRSSSPSRPAQTGRDWFSGGEQLFQTHTSPARSKIRPVQSGSVLRRVLNASFRIRPYDAGLLSIPASRGIIFHNAATLSSWWPDCVDRRTDRQHTTRHCVAQAVVCKLVWVITEFCGQWEAVRAFGDSRLRGGAVQIG